VSRRLTIVVLAAVTVVAVIAVGAAVIWHDARPRLPAVAAVEASADVGIVAVVDAVGDQAAVTVTELVATTACRHTTFARGHIYTRTANLYTDAGAEDALISRIAARLPADFHASRANPLRSPVPPLHAQAGPGVQLTVQVIAAGWISATAQTDCRTTEAAAPAAGSGDGGASAPADITALFRPLGTSAASWHTESVPCAGGAITTTDAISVDTNSAGVASRLASTIPAGARRYRTASNRIIWRTDATSTVVAASDSGTQITAQVTTSTC
jgi:hypothetical protein